LLLCVQDSGAGPAASLGLQVTVAATPSRTVVASGSTSESR